MTAELEVSLLWWPRQKGVGEVDHAVPSSQLWWKHWVVSTSFVGRAVLPDVL